MQELTYVQLLARPDIENAIHADKNFKHIHMAQMIETSICNLAKGPCSLPLGHSTGPAVRDSQCFNSALPRVSELPARFGLHHTNSSGENHAIKLAL